MSSGVPTSGPRTIRRTWAALSGLEVAMRAAMAYRLAFLLQMFFMVVNDLVWLAFWLLVFHNAGSIRGWQASEFLVLFALVAVSAGLSWGIFAGVRDTPHVLESGELDAMLTQPAPVVARMMTRRVDAPLVGDIVFGVVLFGMSGHGDTAGDWLRFFAISTCAGAMMLGFLLVAYSTTFFLRGRPELAQLAGNASLVFTMYPISIFGPMTKLILYTIVPTALMAAIPTELVLEFSWRGLGIVAASTVAMATLGVLAYNAGIRRYRRDSM